MSLSDLASLGSFVSGFAVLISLVFLFFQMRQMTEQVRQSEKNKQALISQGARTRLVQVALARMEPSVAEAVANGAAGSDDLTSTQYQQFLGFAAAQVIGWADAFSQYEEGLLTESNFAPYRGVIKSAMTAPGTRYYWDTAPFGPAYYATNRSCRRVTSGLGVFEHDSDWHERGRQGSTEDGR